MSFLSGWGPALLESSVLAFPESQCVVRLTMMVVMMMAKVMRMTWMTILVIVMLMQ